jgi:hypothetical protein
MVLNWPTEDRPTHGEAIQQIRFDCPGEVTFEVVRQARAELCASPLWKP